MTQYVLVGVAFAVLVVATEFGRADGADVASKVEQGRDLALARSKGNCLACHAIAGGEFPGNVGPPLVAMQARYPDRAKLRAQIWDASVGNALTRMPPYGRQRILTEEEIDLIVDFISTL